MRARRGEQGARGRCSASMTGTRFWMLFMVPSCPDYRACSGEAVEVSSSRSGDGCRQADCYSGLIRRRNFSLPQRCRCAGPTARVLTGRAAVSQSLESMGLERYPKVVIDEPSFDVVCQR